MRQTALERAIEHAGGQKPLADRIGTTQSVVWYWLKRSKRGIPAEWVGRVTEATGIPAHELRPDLYQTGGRAA